MLKPPKIHRQCHSQISHIGNIKTAFNVQADVKNEPRLPPRVLRILGLLPRGLLPRGLAYWRLLPLGLLPRGLTY